MSTRRVSGTASAGERTWRSSGQFRGKGTHTHGEKTVEATFHTCVYKKKPPELLQVRGFNQNGGYLLSHCDAVPSA